MFKKIVVCVDGSECGEHAASVAADIARKFGAEVVLMNVCNITAALTPYSMVPEAATYIGGLEDSLLEAQKAILEKTETLFKRQEINYKLRPEIGQPVDIIVSIAEQESADLIVLGSRGLGGFGRLMLGSVSDGVLHHAHCPVLIVR